MTQSDLQQFYAREKANGRKIRVEIYGSGLSDRVIRAIHTNCRSALEKAVQEGLIKTNPAIGCKLPPKKSREMKVLTPNEVIRFLTQAKEEGYNELFLLELGTGMRRGEILALKWSDLNFKTGELRVERVRIDTDQPEFEPYKPKVRKSGTGCVTMINDHLFEGRYSPKNAYGKRESHNIYAKTREECEKKLAAMIAQVKYDIKTEKNRLKAAEEP